MIKSQLLKTIQKANTKKMSPESAAMIERMNVTKKRVETFNSSDNNIKSITITSGI